MSTLLKVLLGLALVVPMGAYVVGSLVASTAGPVAGQTAVVVPAPLEERVVEPGVRFERRATPEPQPDDLDDDGADDGGDDGADDADDGGDDADDGGDDGGVEVVTPEPQPVPPPAGDDDDDDDGDDDDEDDDDDGDAGDDD